MSRGGREWEKNYQKLRRFKRVDRDSLAHSFQAAKAACARRRIRPFDLDRVFPKRGMGVQPIERCGAWRVESGENEGLWGERQFSSAPLMVCGGGMSAERKRDHD